MLVSLTVTMLMQTALASEPPEPASAAASAPTVAADPAAVKAFQQQAVHADQTPVSAGLVEGLLRGGRLVRGNGEVLTDQELLDAVEDRTVRGRVGSARTGGLLALVSMALGVSSLPVLVVAAAGMFSGLTVAVGSARHYFSPGLPDAAMFTLLVAMLVCTGLAAVLSVGLLAGAAGVLAVQMAVFPGWDAPTLQSAANAYNQQLAASMGVPQDTPAVAPQPAP